MKNFLEVILKNYSIKRAIVAELEQWVQFLVGLLPGFLGYSLRYLFYGLFFKELKSCPIIYPQTRFVFMDKMTMGKNVLINSNCYIYGKGEIVFGDNVLISPGVAIVAGDHDMNAGVPMMLAESKEQKITIEDDVWVGANAVITGGITLATGTIVGAGAVVTKSTEPHGIYAGIPAKLIKKREKQAC